MSVSLPFDDSRRLTGINLYFADVGAVLETVGLEIDDALLSEWTARVRRMRAALGWPDAALVARTHASGASLAFAAPLDQLLTATEVNEWALLGSLFSLREKRPEGQMREAAPNIDTLSSGEKKLPFDVETLAFVRSFHAPGHAAAWDEESALHTLRAFARAERNPPLVALAQAGMEHKLTVLIDEEAISLGVGRGSRVWSVAQLPAPAQIDWSDLREAPIALVTGSNGKTTATRLLAAFTRAHGWRTAHTCTDGVFVGASALAAGDYSGPAGARVALRVPDIEAAILETARGGLLRRGLAVQRADVAVVTNVSDDHFGEYGVHDLDDLAAVKLSVAQALGEDGVLVLNADDSCLVEHAGRLQVRLAWFALDADASLLQAHRAHGGATCGVRNGNLILHDAEGDHDLGVIAAMPLSFNGAARYNIANIAAAALAAHALGLAPALLCEVLARFGSAREDNPGRLQHWSLGGVSVFVDYAHNPDGLRGLLDVATQVRSGRLGLVLGQAGNREDAEIRELAAVAAGFRPDLIVLKEIGDMLRGRGRGEVPEILREELARQGMGARQVGERLDEYEAVREMLAWARSGDTLVLPVHGSAVKLKVGALLDALQTRAWRAGMPLPDHTSS